LLPSALRRVAIFTTRNILPSIISYSIIFVSHFPSYLMLNNFQLADSNCSW
jgi:hypothetical protein